MVNWYKHDIPAWMDGTESLSDGAYRAYHVICQLIYLNEGPIACNEHGIAGRCRQSLRAFRRNLKELMDAEKITLVNGRLGNYRADAELAKIHDNRIKAGEGGEKSGEIRKSKAKALKNNDTVQPTLPDDRSLKDKTREDETRIEPDPRAIELRKAIVNAYAAVNSPHIPDTSRVEVWLRQGHDPEIILATVRSRLERKPSISTLSYFDNAIREAHEACRATAATAEEIDWHHWCQFFKANGSWPTFLGPTPDLTGCRAPADVLYQYGFSEEAA